MPSAIPTDGVCQHDGCEQPVALDMVAIVLDDQTRVCSPACAQAELDDGDVPESVALHDPQFQADRELLGGISDDAVVIERAVSTRHDARTAIDTLSELYPGTFRHNR